MSEGPSFLGEEVDVCVIGSGAGGAPIAWTLARAGAKVVVLEKGPWYRRTDFDHDEIETVRRDYWVPSPDEEPHVQRTNGGPPQRTTNGWISNNVGGGTVHMSGYFYRLHPDDFRMKSLYPDVPGAELEDWPIGYDALAPWYDFVERTIGVSGKAGVHPNEPPRQGDYPLPPVETNVHARLIDAGAAQLGLHPYPIPRAVLSRPYRGRAACAYCDYCGSYGCESGAKSSTMEALVPEAVATGRCEVRPESMAAQIVLDARGRARGVRYYDAEGREQEQRAKLVCVAATAIESARLLLNSVSNRFPNGLANGSGLVGHHLTFSSLAKAYGEFERAALPEPMRARPANHFLDRAVRDFYRFGGKGYDKGGVMHFIEPHRGAIYTADRISRTSHPRLWGARLSEEIMRYYQDVHHIEAEVFGEFLPNSGTKVTVDGDVEDKWGIPSATIHLQPHPRTTQNTTRLADKAVEVLESAGAKRTWTDQVGQVTYVLQHGTCRFGKDPETSVLDPSCRAHEVDNLYVTDASFMPTSGGVPTTFTILANAFRVGAKIVERLETRP